MNHTGALEIVDYMASVGVRFVGPGGVRGVWAPGVGVTKRVGSITIGVGDRYL